MFGNLAKIALGVAAIGTATPTEAVEPRGKLPSAVVHQNGVSANSDIKQVFDFQQSVIKNLEKEPDSQNKTLKLGVAGLLTEVKKLHDAHVQLSQVLTMPDSEVTTHKVAKTIALLNDAHNVIAEDAAALLGGSPIPYSPPGGPTKGEVIQQVAGAQNFTSQLTNSMVAGLNNPAKLLEVLQTLQANFVQP